MSEITREQIVDYLSNLPVLELTALMHELEGKWGVMAQPAQLSVPVPTSVPTGPGQIDQMEFSVIIIAVPSDKKIGAIKVVREITGLGLKEAKDFVEAVSTKPMPLKEGLSKADAEELQKKLQDAGCTAQLQ